MGQIASDSTSASAAVVGVTGISVNQGPQASLTKSTIASMKTGVTVNNQLMTDLEQLVSCVQEQSQKFPKIAELMDLRDKQSAEILRGS